MLQYLLNTTAIWLLSLLCFDLFLKRETYHTANRSYLLATLLLGIIVPLITWPSHAVATSYISNVRQPLYYPVEQVRQTAIKTVTLHDTPSFHWTTFVQWLYLAGAAISLLLLLREIFVLVRYYRTGRKNREGRYTIIETYHDHGPFSVGRLIFVNSKKNYDEEQWQIVLQHEKRHTQLLHFADMIFLQLVQIVFWFHPLVYLYRRRLLLVHEYQADAAACLHPLQYSHFLVEQSLLQRGPSSVHSLNYSPIKNRLRMLTKNASSKMAKARFLLIVPVLLAGIICFAKSKEKHERRKTGNTIIYNGNTFTLNEDRTDNMVTTDPETGKKDTMVITALAYPVKMNGKEIYNDAKVEDLPVYADGSLEEKILDVVKEDLAKLPDAENYTISIFNTIVDEQGKLVYFDVRGLEQYFYLSDPDKGRLNIDPQLKAIVVAKVNNYLDGTHKFKPGRLNGKNVICVANLKPLSFAVKNHKVTYTFSLK